ncbi:MAG: phosphate--acyl-ACP acyltransferase, partial [Flavobacteriia bacterium]|nr:phosphate--acyl-ACP acyltransferase [Flavobacteriia bacterium]
MKIGIDISGGDFAPAANLDGAILAQKELKGDAIIVLIGDEEQINSGLRERNITDGLFEIIHAPEVITFHDHPTRALSKKPNSSISIGFNQLAKGELHAF